MIEDMTIRKFAAKTQQDYVQRVKNFAAFLGRSPDTASFDDVRRYQLHLAARGAGVPTLNQSVATLRFLFRVTLKRYDIVEHTHFIHEPRKLPVVLSPQEVARLLDAAPGLAVLAYLSRYTHRVAIANSRLLALDDNAVTFTWKDYRIEGADRYKVMTLAPNEFIRRFLIHVLPPGFHRIRHYGLFAKTAGVDNIARARQLLGLQKSHAEPTDAEQSDGSGTPSFPQPCPCCGGRMFIIETFARGTTPRYRPGAPIIAVRIDTS
jgi:hypothetical protein